METETKPETFEQYLERVLTGVRLIHGRDPSLRTRVLWKRYYPDPAPAVEELTRWEDDGGR